MSIESVRLWLVRHGQTDWNLEGRYQGHADMPLNALGLAQARLLADKLYGEVFDALYTSDLERAYQTARVLADSLDLEPVPDPRLREIHQGEWQGLLVVDVAQRFTAEVERRRADPLSARPPGGESVGELAARMASAAGDIARRHPGGKVLVVSHGLSMAALLAQARGVPLAQVYTLIPENTQVEVVEWGEG
jgi:broad specificity phosphatase PhoE